MLTEILRRALGIQTPCHAAILLLMSLRCNVQHRFRGLRHRSKPAITPAVETQETCTSNGGTAPVQLLTAYVQVQRLFTTWN